MSNLSELLPSGGGQNVGSFVASGALTNGLPVALRTDGKVEAVTSGNITSFIGITGQAISDTATGNVDMLGGINSQQTSLVIGSKYYIQSDGSLAVTVTSAFAGQAISATTLNIRDLT